MRHFLNGLLISLGIVYPLAVYFGLEHFGVQGLVVLLLSIFLLRITASYKKRAIWQSVALAFTVTGLAATVYYYQNLVGLRLYPVVINAVLFCVFGYSVLSGMPIIEKVARITEPDLPPKGVIYTRNVTLLWCGFFIVNGSIALYTALFTSLKVWSLYNGLIAYALMGIIFVLEFFVRIQLKRKHAKLEMDA